MIGVTGEIGADGELPPQAQTIAAIEADQRMAAQSLCLAPRIEPIGFPMSARTRHPGAAYEPVALHLKQSRYPERSDSRFAKSRQPRTKIASVRESPSKLRSGFADSSRLHHICGRRAVSTRRRAGRPRARVEDPDGRPRRVRGGTSRVLVLPLAATLRTPLRCRRCHRGPALPSRRCKSSTAIGATVPSMRVLPFLLPHLEGRASTSLR